MQSETIVFCSGQKLAYAMVYLIFTCIRGTRLFVYENKIGNKFVKAICHSVSFYTELFFFPLSKPLAFLSYLSYMTSLARQ